MDDFDFSAPSYHDFQHDTADVIGVEDDGYFGKSWCRHEGAWRDT